MGKTVSFICVWAANNSQVPLLENRAAWCRHWLLRQYGFQKSVLSHGLGKSQYFAYAHFNVCNFQYPLRFTCILSVLRSGYGREPLYRHIPSILS